MSEDREVGAGQGEELTFTVEFSIKPDSLAQFETALREIFAEVRGKSDLLYYAWLQNPDEPGSILVHEAWKSSKRFNEDEVDQPYRGRFDRTIEPLLNSPKAYREWDLAGSYNLPEEGTT